MRKSLEVTKELPAKAIRGGVAERREASQELAQLGKIPDIFGPQAHRGGEYEIDSSRLARTGKVAAGLHSCGIHVPFDSSSGVA